MILPTIGYELEKEEMQYVECGDFFIGISMSAATCIGLYNALPGGTPTFYPGFFGDVAKMAMAVPAISGFVKSTIATISAALSAIPVWGWVCIGILAAATIALVGAMLYNGYHGKGFRIGFEVSTGWLGLPIGAKWVCE